MQSKIYQPIVETPKQRYRALSPSNRRIVLRIMHLLGEAEKGHIVAAYELGCAIRGALEDEYAFVCQTVEVAAAVAEIPANELYRYRDLASTFSRHEIVVLAKRKLPDGSRIQTAHLLAAKSIPESRLRRQLLDRVIEEGWSVEQLIDAYIKMTRTPRQPRPPRLPSLNKGIQQIFTAAQAMMRRIPVWQEVVFDEVSQPPSTTVNPELVASASVVQQHLQKLADSLARGARQMETGIEHMQRVLALRAPSTAPKQPVHSTTVVNTPQANPHHNSSSQTK